VSYIKRDFKNIAFIGNQPLYFLKNLPGNIQPENIFLCDISLPLLSSSLSQLPSLYPSPPPFNIIPVVLDEELFCFKPDSLDLILSSGHLHFVN
jgi:hypothetical protein